MFFVALAAAAVVAAQEAPQATSPQPAAATAPAAAPAAPPAAKTASAKPALICHTEGEIGTRFTRKVCRSPAEDAQARLQEQQALRDAQRTGLRSGS